MKNARRYDDRITLGLVPDTEDLEQLRALGYKTLIDLRDEPERFGGFVERRARDFGLHYIGIPINRDEIRIEDVEKFYRVVFETGNEPLYVFSRFGRKPLAFLLLLEATLQRAPLFKIFQRARKFGLGGLDGDLSLQSFLVQQINSPSLNSIVESVVRGRPEQLQKSGPSQPAEKEPEDLDLLPIDESLADISSQWARTGDKAALRARLQVFLAQLES
jgi:protein tyrosine phosphatase (PTP) superfamily phosphohydrolase (DUF442 family)